MLSGRRNHTASSARGKREEALELAEAWMKAESEVVARWGELTRWLLETQARGQAEVMWAITRLREPAA